MAADLNWSNAVPLLSLESAKAEQHISATHSFESDGQAQRIVVLSDRLALDLSPVAEADTSKLTPFGLQLSRSLDSQFSVFTTAQTLTSEFVTSLQTSGLIDEVVPVFGMIETGTEAVLLDEVIVALPAGTDPNQYFADARFESFRRLDGTPDQFVAKLKNVAGPDALAVINQLDQESTNSWIAPNFYQAWKKQYFPNDPRFNNLWHLHNIGQGGGMVDADPNVPEAWDVIQGATQNIIVGVVDDGVAIDHPDLDVWVNPGEIAGDGIDNDLNGWIDDINGWNFVTNNNVSYNDTAADAHGTAVAGVAAARGDNGIGVAGPAYKSKVISARIFRDNGVASDAGIASAIYYASGRTANGLGTFPASHIVNHSWGGGGPSTAISSAMVWASTLGRGGLGAPQLVATGNGFGAVSLPASLSATIPGLFAIGALNNFGEKSNYSNFGPSVDVVTPSNDTRAGFLAIDTTDRLGAAGYSPDEYTGTGAFGFGGTSSATPLATGIGALALARASQLGVNITAAELKLLFRNNTKLIGPDAFPLPGARNDNLGYGLLNAQTLVQGIGVSKISLTTDTQEIDHLEVVNVGPTILDSTRDISVRIRNQGTLPLNLNSITTSVPALTISQNPAPVLQLGESTIIKVRIAALALGTIIGDVTVASNDPALPSMVFTIRTDVIASTVSGYYFEDIDRNFVKSPTEPGIPGQTVLFDTNGNGVVDSITRQSLTQVNIPDNQTVTGFLPIVGVPGSVEDVNVTINLIHTWVSDLRITLVSPSGTRVTLVQNRGGSGDNFSGTTFDDSASNPISGGVAPFSGSFRPETPLSAIVGDSINGLWSLEVTDSATLDTGVLFDWSLTIAIEKSVLTDGNGFYFVQGLPNGNYDVRSFTPLGYLPIGPTQYPITVTGPADTFRSRSFGFVSGSLPPTINPIADMVIDEDSGLQTVALSGITAGLAETQPLQVTVRSSSTVLIPTPSVSYSSPSSTGSISFAPAANRNGIARIFVTVTDPGFDQVFGTGDEETVEVSFQVTVLPINDLPTMNALLDISILEDSATTQVQVSGINAGPFESQPLRLTAVSGNTSLIPTVNVDYNSPQSTGILSFSPLANQWGSSVITVTLMDGGNDNNLNTLPGNLFITKSFTVTVLPVQDAPSFAPVSDITIDEDSLDNVVTITGIDAGGGEVQPMRIIAKTSSPGNLVELSTTYTSPDVTGTIEIDTLPNQFGSLFVTVILEDGGADANLNTAADNLFQSRTFTVTVLPINDPPTINPVPGFIIDEDAPRQTINLTGLSAGVSETEPFTVSILSSSNPELIGVPVLNHTWPSTTGQISFTPVANKFGTAQIVVEMMDAGDDYRLSTTNDNATRLETITITVRPVNDAPTLNSINNLSMAEDSASQFVDLTGITAGVDEAQPLRVTASSGNVGLMSNPVVSYLSPNATGSLSIVPIANQHGTSVIVVTVEDGGVDANLSTTADNTSFSRTFTVNVTPVNDAPVIDALSNIAVNEDAPQQTTLLTGISAGPNESQPIRITASSSNTALIPSPSVDYVSPSTAGNISWTPRPNMSGTATITLTVEDGGSDGSLGTTADNLTTQTSFVVTVGEVNDLPTIDVIQQQITIQEDAGPTPVNLTGITAGGNENQPLRISVAMTDGTVLTSSVSYTSPNATGVLTLDTIPEQSGGEIVVVTVEDGGLDNDLSTLADNASRQMIFAVFVQAVDDDPVIDDIPDASTPEETVVTIDLSGIGAGGDESQTLRVSASSSNGTLLAAPQVFYTSPEAIAAISLTPLTNEVGQSVITVTVEDGGLDNSLVTLGDNKTTSKQFTLTVTPVDDQPRVDAVVDVAFDEDGTATVSVTGINAGPNENQPLSVDVQSDNPSLVQPEITYISPENTASITLIGGSDQVGSAVITVLVSDGGADNDLSTEADNLTTSTTFTVVVNPVNDEPAINSVDDVSVDEDGQLSVDLSGIGAGGGETQSIRVSAVSLTTGLLPNPQVAYVSPAALGILLLAPNANQSGQAIVEVTVEDAGLDNDFSTTTDNATQRFTFTVNVDAVNDDPAFDTVANTSVDEDGQIDVSVTGISAGPGESQVLQVSATSSNPSVVPDPIVTYSSPASLATLSIEPVADAFGSAVITVEITDGGADNDLDTTDDNGSTTRMFTVSVAPTNDAPTIDNPSDLVVHSNSPEQTVDLTGISDGPGETGALIVRASSNTPAVIASTTVVYSGGSTATLSFTPESDEFGLAEIEVVVEDGGEDDDLATTSDNSTMTLTFQVLVNAVPVAQGERIRTVFGTSIDANLLSNDSDADGTTADLEVVIVQAPPATEGSVTVLLNGQVRFTPAAGFAGVSMFTYAAMDENGAQSTPAEVTVGVGRTKLQNPFMNLDVNNDGAIGGSDAVLILNLLNDPSQSRFVDDLPETLDDLDVNGDGIVAASDAVLIINFLNARADGEGESSSDQPSTVTNDMFFGSHDELTATEKRLKNRRLRG
jgi:subtilisin-like proprotein convertase family protein